jgi:serine/threonine protein kinase
VRASERASEASARESGWGDGERGGESKEEEAKLTRASGKRVAGRRKQSSPCHTHARTHSYMLLSGTPPFPGNGENEILMRVKKGNYDLNISKFDMVSSHAKDFIKKLLVMDPKKRMSAKQAQEHQWLHDFDVPSEPLDTNIAESLKSFHQ